MTQNNEREVITKLALECGLLLKTTNLDLCPSYLTKLEAFAKAYVISQNEQQEVVSTLEDWLTINMPSGTVIGDPLWWARKIRNVLALTEAPKQIPDGWISVNDRLPETDKQVLAIVLDKDNTKGWRYELVNYGNFDYVCMYGEETEEADEDGVVYKHGWHYGRESEGEYDYLVFDLENKVSHWMPLPTAPTNTEVGE